MNASITSLEDAPLNPFHRLLGLRTGGGWVMDGYVLSIIGVALTQMVEELQLDNFWQGMIAASALLGIFAGGFIGGYCTAIWGRKRLYLFAPLLFIACSVAQFFVESGAVLFALRFLIGIGVGFEYTVAGSLYTEFLPKKYRGPKLCTLTTLWFFGAALAYVVGNAILHLAPGEDAWRWIVASPALIGVFLVLIRLGTPESPRWLLSQGRGQEAERIIQRVYGPQHSLKSLPEEGSGKPAALADLFRAGYGLRMLFVSLFWICSVTPVFAIYAFAPRVLEALSLHAEAAVWGQLLITAMFVLGCMLGTWLVEALGRRPMIIHSFFWSALALALLGFFPDGPATLTLVLFAAYALFIGGAQVLQITYPNEIFPTEIRTLAVGVGASMSRIGAAMGTWLVPFSLQHLGIGQTMLAACAITLVGFVACVLLAPETRGLDLAAAASLKRN